MSVSVFLKSLSRVTGEKNRRRPVGHVAMLTEQFEVRQLLSGLTILGSDLPKPPAGGNTGGGTSGSPVPLTNLPLLNSRPGAPVSVILKMDGYTDNDPGWIAFRNRGTGPIVTPAFDLDGDPLTFNTEELRQIEEIWYRVAEDFSPLNINVTTIAPPTLNDFEHVMVIIGGSNDWAPAAGGWGVVDGFSTGGANTNYVFSGLFFNAHQIASASSHESGHTFGLRHQSLYDANGNQTAQYNPGDPSSAPIMGVGYGTIRDTWWNGTSSISSTTIQDDLAQLTRAANRTVRYRTDDFGNTIASAFRVPLAGPTFSVNGVLEQNGDVDLFRIETNTGPVSFSVDGLDLRQVYGLPGITQGTNADLIIRLFDANGALIAENDPANSLSASLSASVTAGTYFVAVTHISQYGSIGQYTLAGNVIPLPSTPTMIAPTGTLSSPLPTFEWTVGANAASYDLEVDNLTTGRVAFYSASVTGLIHTPPSQFAEGVYQARVRTVASDGTFSGWSNYVSFTIDVPTPAKPVITRPSGDIITSFPTFVWNYQGDASLYTLWVGRVGGSREIYRTNHSTNTYQHFNPLKDGSYRAWVQAFNSVGERSAWSDPVEFTIDAPTPTVPTITAPTVTTTNQNPRIVWTAGEDVWKYDLWVNYLNGSVGQYIRQQDIQGRNYYDPAALPQGTYKAWVRAINGNDEVSAWSTPYTFTVDVLPPAKPVMTGPITASGSTVLETQNPTFMWNSAARAVVYELWVNNDTTRQSQIILNTNIPDTSFTPLTNLPQGAYRAWVRGRNSANEVGPWSEAWSFSIDQPVPSVPTIVAPTANPAGSVTTSTPTFVWTTNVKGDFYELRLNDLTLNKQSVLRVNNIIGESYTITWAQRLPEHSYTAEVRAGNSAGEYSDWSTLFPFRIDVPNPLTPQILAPSNTLRTRTPKFEWVHSKDSVRYEILVRDLERNEDIVLNVSTFTLNPAGDVASYILPANKALGNGTYRFWIRAFNSLGTPSAWSASRTFVILVSVEPSLNSEQQLFSDVAGEPVVTAVSRQSGDFAAPQDDDSENVMNSAGDSPARPTTVPERTEDQQIMQQVMEELADPARAEFLTVGAAMPETPDKGTSVKSGSSGLAAGAALMGLFPFRRRRNDDEVRTGR